MIVSKHFIERLQERGILEIASPEEIRGALRKVGRLQVGETHVLVKRLPDTRVIYHPYSEGDELYLVLRRAHEADPGALVTVMLRGQCQRPKAGVKYLK